LVLTIIGTGNLASRFFLDGLYPPMYTGGMTLSDFLKAKRMERGLTQAEVATLAATSTPTISNYETGARVPELATVKRLSKVLRFSLGDLERVLIDDS
jgi:DNA-binding XRE family transcriptional regulator